MIDRTTDTPNHQTSKPTDTVDLVPVQLDFLEKLTVTNADSTGDLAHPLPELPREGRSWGKTALALGAVLLIGTLGYFGIRNMSAKPGGKEKVSKTQKITPVMVAPVTRRTVPIQLQAIGTIQPGVTVAVTPQVGGRVNGVYFKKGQDIKKGQLLFSIDEQPQSAAIQQIQGTLQKGGAQVQQARATFDKDTGLIAQAQTTLEKDLQAVEQAKATLDKDIGLIALAKANRDRDLGLVQQAKAVLLKDQAQSRFTVAQNQRYSNLYKQGAVSQDQAQQYLSNSQVSAATIQADIEAIKNAEATVRGDEAAIKNAEAVVRGDLAAIKNAEAVVKGDRVAIENAKAVVRGDRAAIQSAQAGISSDRGSLRNAQVQMGYTKIYAPIDGRAGNILVQVGNVVQPTSNNPLVNIVQIHPIQVSFAVPSNSLPEIQRQMSNGKLPVGIKLSPSDPQSISGQLSFVNNTVDNTTGTVQLIGDFDNTDGRLWPGQYVNATLTLNEIQNAIVVPAQAVQNGPNGQFVFVVKPDETVENVPVVATSAIDGLNVIEKGLRAGDRVVTDGQANLVAGAQVKLQGAADKAGDPASDKPRRRRSAAGESPDATTPATPTGDSPSSPPDRATGTKGDEAVPGERKGKRRSANPADRPASPTAGGNP
jgi:membrane fusion protein, multidrug efflux system